MLKQEDKLRVYLASPFFNEQQIAIVEKLEVALRARDFIELFSPRSAGPINHLSPEEKAAKSKAIFEDNIDKIKWAELIVAVIDDRDTGVMFEVGFAHSIGKAMVSYTEQNYAVNIMIRHAVDGHIHGVDELNRFLDKLSEADDAFADFQNFNPNVI